MRPFLLFTFPVILFYLLTCFAIPTLADPDSEQNNYGVLNPLGHQVDAQPVSRIEDGKRTFYFPSANRTQAKVYMFSSTNLSDVYLGTKSAGRNQDGRYWDHLPNTAHIIFEFTPGVHQLPEAPVMFKWNDTAGYVMYVSSDGPEGNRLYALHNDGNDLTKNWTFAGVVQYTDGTPLNGYDAFAFNHPNGEKYILYTNVTTIFINRINPTKGYATIDYPSEDERKEGLNGTVVVSRYSDPFIEAPDIFISGKTMNFLWTENDFFSPNYTTYARAISTNLNPLEAKTWETGKKVEILASNNQTGVYGTGSVGTFIGPNDQPWIAYTCFYQNTPFDRSVEDRFDPRMIQTQPLNILDDVIQPMVPLQPNRPGFHA